MKNLIERLLKARADRQENREGGFSLIELIVVIAIIGILIAIAIPVYGNIQNTAKVNQLKNAAATGASLFAATLASEGAAAAKTAVENSDGVAGAADGKDYVLTVSGTATDLTNFCVEAAAKGATDGAKADDDTAFVGKSGPSCS